MSWWGWLESGKLSRVIATLGQDQWFWWTKTDDSLIGNLSSELKGSEITKLAYNDGKRVQSFKDTVISDKAIIAQNKVSEGVGNTDKAWSSKQSLMMCQ